jgi:hypothetical protein
MQAKHRALLEVLVLIGLCIAIAQAFSRELGGGHHARPSVEAAAYLSFLAGLPLLLGVGGVIYGVWRMAIAMTLDVSLLTGALWELVRLMENYNRNASSGRAGARKELLHHFAVEGAERVAAGRPMPMGDTAGLDLTRLAFELMDRNDRDGSGYSRKVNSIRRGLFAFYAIVELKRPEIAFRAMCEHMKTQIQLGDDSGIDNFTDLKRLLGLPAGWPADLRMIADFERRGLSVSRELAIRKTVRTGLTAVFKGVQYVPPGETGVSHAGADAILKQMREYIR